jgi:ubiquinone/menaquinone biosynthesis C-methylase UbiE
MKDNKHIERDGQSATKIFDNRRLKVDYRTLEPILKKGMTVLDVGCGTGSISKDIANIVGDYGKVIGIDNTLKFIESGKETYKNTQNLYLIHSDLFDFETNEKFDLIVSARTLQWLSNPKEALLKMKSLLNPNGIISILDYNHNKLEWNPEPPNSMKEFYKTFLKWRSDAGMNNKIADDLPELMKEIGMVDIEKINSDEHYGKHRKGFNSKVGIWSKVASSTQMVEEGYLKDDLRLKAIEEYDEWVESKAISMTMKLNEVRGKMLAINVL